MNPDDSILGPGQDTLLELKLDELRRELAQVHAPDAMEEALRARFRKTKPAAPRPRPRLWWMPPLALAATIAITSWMIRGPMPDSQSLVALATPTTTIEGDRDPGPFLALQPLDRIAHEAGTRVVTTEFPRALLADWGLPVSPDRAGEPVRAEMLYSADGEPLAVRLIN
jgi:hypothetical protein